MPFYKINGMQVHMRGTKLPPACRARVRVGKAGLDAAFECVLCLAPSSFLCDFPIDNKKSCDMPLCQAHAGQVGPNKNHCPEHLLQSRTSRQPGLFTSLVNT